VVVTLGWSSPLPVKRICHTLLTPCVYCGHLACETLTRTCVSNRCIHLPFYFTLRFASMLLRDKINIIIHTHPRIIEYSACFQLPADYHVKFRAFVNTERVTDPPKHYIVCNLMNKKVQMLHAEVQILFTFTNIRIYSVAEIKWSIKIVQFGSL